MQLQVKNLAGEVVSSIEVDEQVFGLEPRIPLMHQAVLMYLANRRRGTHSTKTRGEVRGSTRKIQRQKGLGRARQGGIVFGPKPRDYSQAMPKRMRRLAIRCALSAKVRDGELIVIEGLQVAAPKTKAIVEPLRALGATRTVLLVTAQPDENVKLSARNVEGATYMPADSLNTYDILRNRHLVLTVDAVRRIEALWGGERANQRRPLVTTAAAGGEQG